MPPQILGVDPAIHPLADRRAWLANVRAAVGIGLIDGPVETLQIGACMGCRETHSAQELGDCRFCGLSVWAWQMPFLGFEQFSGGPPSQDAIDLAARDLTRAAKRLERIQGPAPLEN